MRRTDSTLAGVQAITSLTTPYEAGMNTSEKGSGRFASIFGALRTLRAVKFSKRGVV